MAVADHAVREQVEGNLLARSPLIRSVTVFSGRWAARIGAFVVLVAVWEWVVDSGRANEVILPPPSRIMVSVQVADKQRLKWPLSKTDFQPIDLVSLANDKDNSVQNGELMVRIKEQIRKRNSLSSDTPMSVDFRDRSGFTDNQISLFELRPLLETLASLLRSDALRPRSARQLSPKTGPVNPVAFVR